MRLERKNCLPIGIDPKELRAEQAEKKLKAKRGYTKAEIIQFYEENNYTQSEVAKMFGIHLNTMHYYLQVMGKVRKGSKHAEEKRQQVTITLTKDIVDKLQAEGSSASAIIEESLKKYFKNKEKQEAKHRINIFAEPKILEREPKEKE